MDDQQVEILPVNSKQLTLVTAGCSRLIQTIKLAHLSHDTPTVKTANKRANLQWFE